MADNELCRRIAEQALERLCLDFIADLRSPTGERDGGYSAFPRLPDRLKLTSKLR